ncbi:MAG: xylulokinase [Actinomycetota bacterium]
MSIVLGIDSSTQSTKVEARRIDDGTVVASASAKHPPTTPPVSEQDPVAWWDALVEAVQALAPDVRDEVTAVAVAGQQHGLVLLDETGLPLRLAKLWNDTTSASQADRLVAVRGRDAWADAVGSVPVAAFTVSKLAWVVDEEPDLLNRVARVGLPHDYLTMRLCGAHVTDRGDASGTGWFDPSTDRYVPELLESAGVGADWTSRLPSVLGPTEPAGTLTGDAAAALGLPDTTLVGPGSGDNMGAALGLGLAPGDLVMSLGTSGVAYARSTTSTHDPSGAVAGFADAAGGYLPLVCTLNATKVTDTVAAWLGTDAPGLADLALQAEGADELTVVPWFDGERTPNRPDASGTMLGLRTDTSRAQLARAAHDGVLCGLFHGIEALADCGVSADGTLHLIGGGARSVAYRRRCADLWGRPVLVPDADETVATGAAVQAAVIAGGEAIDDVQRRWSLGAGTTIEPDTSVDGAAIRERYAAATR